MGSATPVLQTTWYEQTVRPTLVLVWVPKNIWLPFKKKNLSFKLISSVATPCLRKDLLQKNHIDPKEKKKKRTKILSLIYIHIYINLRFPEVQYICTAHISSILEAMSTYISIQSRQSSEIKVNLLCNHESVSSASFVTQTCDKPLSFIRYNWPSETGI
jgi:hypothetical protein